MQILLKRWMKGTSTLDIHEELTESAGYKDSFKDVIGYEINFCDSNSGYSNTAMDRTPKSGT